jgi:anti-sigma factor RsiW
MNVFLRNSQRQHVPVDLLSAYLDNQVTAAERGRIEGHLSSCETCQRELEALRQTVGLLHAMPRLAVPRAFTLSEAQVGIRRPAARPAWYGGVLRGMGAVAAVVLVALIATSLLRRPAWTPTQLVARAPQPAPASPLAQAATATMQRKAVTAVTVEEKAIEAQPQPAAPTAAPAATVGATKEAPLALAAPTQAPAAPAPPTEAPPTAPKVQALPTAEAASAATATPEPVPTAEKEAMAAAAALPSQPAPAAADALAAAPGRGGGGMGASGPTAAEAKGTAAEPPPPVAPAAAVLPAAAGVVYVDQGSLWALDRQSGQRQVLAAPDIGAPLISDDRAWITYRIQQPDHVELWAVPWGGGQPKMVMDERALPASSLPQGYRERHIQSVTWIPGRHHLAVITGALADDESKPPHYELWDVDVESGAIGFLTAVGQSDRPFYAPSGTRFALARNSGSNSGLWLFDADGSNGRSALPLPQSAGGTVYNWQVSWLRDGSALRAAVPESPSTLALYRVPASGRAELSGRIEAVDAYWSPDGSRLAYTKPVSDSLDIRELYLANGDGAEPSLYATPRYWAFLGWAPDSKHFLYQDNQQVYVGAPGQPPQALGNFLSIFDPRWISGEQFLHLLDQNANWVLVSRWLDGRAASLVTLPRDAELDVTPR